MTIGELADKIKNCSKDELKELEREIRLAWAKDKITDAECFEMVTCILQGSESNYNSQ